MSKPSKSKKKVLLIGWDAADWKVIDPLLEAGKMPNLAKLLGQGVRGNIATLQPALSPTLWTSIATGKRPYKHGIHGFSEPDPVTGNIRPVTNLSRKTKAIWNILNQEEKNTITVGWWPSNPAEPLSKGVMVSNDYQTAHGNDPKKWPLKPGTIHPERLEKHLTDLRFHPSELDQDDLLPFLPGLEGLNQEELDKVGKDPRMMPLAKTIADCTSIHSAATALIQNEPWDLMCVYYDAIDHFGHAFMKYHPPQRPQVSDHDFRIFSYVTEAGYRYHDMMLGTLMSLAGEDTTIMLLSDHGFHPDDLRLSNIPNEPAGPAAEHRQFGIFAAMGPGIKQNKHVFGASLIDICPTLLHLFGLPAGEDMDGKALLDIYQDLPTPLQSIPSWDQVEGDHGMHPSDKQISAEDSKAALDQLVGLGYIDEPDADQSKALERTVRELDYNLAQAWIDGGIFTEAIAILERLYERWPMEHRFGFKLATCYNALGRIPDLRVLVTLVIERRLQEAETAVTELNALNLEDEEVQKAEKEKIKAMSKQDRKKFFKQRSDLFAKARPNIFALHYFEAIADFAENKFTDALTKLDQLNSHQGTRLPALTLRGEICQRLQRWADSRAAFEEALQIDSETPSALIGLARTSMAERNFPQAILDASASVKLIYFQPRAHYMIGLAHYRLGQYELAEHACRVCVKQAPLFSAAYRLLGEIAYRHHHNPQLVVFFKEQVKEARRQMVEIRRKGASGERTASTITDDSRPMPMLQPRAEVLAETPAAKIITIVSGLPRSGTSLMMQILEAAGIPAYTDGNRKADDSNSKGYYEHDKVSALLKPGDRSWISETRGHALKVVAPLLAVLPVRVKTKPSELQDEEGPKLTTPNYRVLFMERDLEEILQSQASMLQRLGRKPPSGDVSKAYNQQERHAKTWLNGHGIPAMSIDFAQLVHDPAAQLSKLAAFLGCEDKLPAMRAVIDPSMHRARASLTASDA